MDVDIFRSPKRKRRQESPDDTHIQESINLKSASDIIAAESGSGSPRSKVARQLSDLEIEPQPLAIHHAREPKKVACTRTQQPPGPLVEPQFATANSPAEAQVLIKSLDVQTISKPRAGSPKLDGDPEDNPMFWQDSEITGHNPTDPSDDGYGFNGIGFRPTAAEAWSRSQRRKQQLLEYKNREAREARERRSARRRSGLAAAHQNCNENLATPVPKVHFEAG